MNGSISQGAAGVGFAHRLNLPSPTVIYGSYANGGGEEHIDRFGVATEFCAGFEAVGPL